MSQPDVYRMTNRCAVDAGIQTKIGLSHLPRDRHHGLSANHESVRITGHYDRRNDQVSLDEVERILI